MIHHIPGESTNTVAEYAEKPMRPTSTLGYFARKASGIVQEQNWLHKDIYIGFYTTTFSHVRRKSLQFQPIL